MSHAQPETSVMVVGARPLTKLTNQRLYRLALVESMIAQYARESTHEWPAIKHMEWLPLLVIKRRSLISTPLEPCLPLFGVHGLARTATLGDCMHLLGLTRRDLHSLLCQCFGHTVSGAQMVRRLDFYANYHLRYA